MSPWAPRAKHKVPPVGSPAPVAEINDYSLGMNSFLANDVIPFKNGRSNYWRLAQNARITSLGQYDTRKGFDNYTDTLLPLGSTSITTITSTTGAADQNLGGTNWIAQPFTTVGAVRLVQAYFTLKNANGATGTPLMELWTNSGGRPAAFVARSSMPASVVTGSYTSVHVDFPSAPLLAAATQYWLVMHIQATGSGNYSARSTTTNTSGLTSINSGSTWSTNSFGFNLAVWGATNAPVIGIHDALKSDGTNKVLYASGTTLCSIDTLSTTPTSIKTGLSASATAYRFVTVNDIVYYVNGFDGYRKWDFTTESQVNATNYTHICVHKGLVFLVSKNEPNKLVYSNFGDYETFTSTDFFNIPAPKTGDPITALVSLNGYLLVFTRRNKFILSGEDNSTFQLNEAPDQKGTFTQETVTQDQNFVYYLTDDGVYRSNGNEAQIMSTNVYQSVFDIANKPLSCMTVNGGRLYLWYSSAGSAANDKCWVWNLNYDTKSQTVESFDTEAYVSRAVTGTDTDFPMIVGSSLVGTAFWQELPSNDYNNLGGDIDFYLQTHYITFGSPGVLKEVRRWIYRVDAQSGNYNITALYAYDLRDNFQSIGDLAVQGSGAIWGSGIVWGAFTWGTDAEIQSTNVVPGEYRRFAFAYKHYATRQPNSFLGHSFLYQTRRFR